MDIAQHYALYSDHLLENLDKKTLLWLSWLKDHGSEDEETGNLREISRALCSFHRVSASFPRDIIVLLLKRAHRYVGSAEMKTGLVSFFFLMAMCTNK